MVVPEHPDVPLWPFLSAASGSAGDVTASRNAHGQYFRTRVTPTNPNTARQAAVRIQFHNMHSTYEGRTTAAQKDAWNTYARSVSVRGRLGDRIYITGWNWFVRINQPRLTAALPFKLSPPTDLTAAWTSLCQFKYVASPPTLSISRDPNQDWWPEPGAVYYHYVTADYSTTITSFKPPWKFLGIRAAVGPPVVSFTLPYTPTTGNRIFTRYRLQRADGRLSPWYRASGIVTAT